MGHKRRIIITGGNSGLGFELSTIYLQEGYEVICLSRKKPEIDVTHVYLDYTKEISISEAALEIEEKYSDFDTFIHCTGIGYIEAFEDMKYTHSKEMMDVNLLGPTIFSAKLLPLVKKNQADILCV